MAREDTSDSSERLDKARVMSDRFFAQAQADLRVADLLLRPDGYYKAIECAYQAAEKGLKAVAWVAGLGGGGRHNLVGILQRVSVVVGEPPADVAAAVKQLEPMWDDVRYPSGREAKPIPAEAFGEEDARVAISASRKVLQWVGAELQRR
jgi:HEPN domain-containing protein